MVLIKNPGNQGPTISDPADEKLEKNTLDCRPDCPLDQLPAYSVPEAMFMFTKIAREGGDQREAFNMLMHRTPKELASIFSTWLLGISLQRAVPPDHPIGRVVLETMVANLLRIPPSGSMH